MKSYPYPYNTIGVNERLALAQMKLFYAQMKKINSANEKHRNVLKFNGFISKT